MPFGSKSPGWKQRRGNDCHQCLQSLASHEELGSPGSERPAHTCGNCGPNNVSSSRLDSILCLPTAVPAVPADLKGNWCSSLLPTLAPRISRALEASCGSNNRSKASYRFAGLSRPIAASCPSCSSRIPRSADVFASQMILQGMARIVLREEVKGACSSACLWQGCSAIWF